MNNIRFTENYNGKLAAPVFSTIRRFKGGENYYQDRVGAVFNVLHGDRVLCTAKLISARLVPFNAIPIELIAVDTGRANYKEAMAVFEGFYGLNFDQTGSFFILLFERVKAKV